jgi:hypothetical protein
MLFHPKAVSTPIGMMTIMSAGAWPLIIFTFQIREFNQVIIFQSAEVAGLFPYSRCVNHQVILCEEQSNYDMLMGKDRG